MYKVLIVDDEAHILNFLKKHIDWRSLNLDVVAVTTNSDTALKIAVDKSIDILISDIKMQEMNGLTLCKKVSDSISDVQIIIISAFSDFDYAKKAIELRVLGYCLKPLNTNELTRLLKIAIKNLKKTNVINGDELLDTIEYGNTNEIMKAFNYLGINSDKYYIATSINTGNITNVLGAKITIKIGKHKYLYFSDTKFNIKNAKKIICYSNKIVGISVIPYAVTAKDLKNEINKSLIMAFQFFITKTSSFSEKLVYGELINDVFNKLNKSSHSKELLKDLINEIKNANSDMIFNIKTAYKFYNDVLHSQVMRSKYDQDEDFVYSYEQLLYQFGNFDNLLDNLMQILDEKKDNTPIIKPSVSSFIQIIKYLNENFEKDISLQYLAEYFNMNASYISYLIKKETGLTYSKYLNNLRIQKAKDLLKNSELSILEISETVGFHDYFYFIKKFKKITGVTPGYFKKNMGY